MKLYRRWIVVGMLFAVANRGTRGFRSRQGKVHDIREFEPKLTLRIRSVTMSEFRPQLHIVNLPYDISFPRGNTSKYVSCNVSS